MFACFSGLNFLPVDPPHKPHAMSQIAVGAMLILALGISSGQQRAESVKSSSESDFDGKLVSDSDNEPQM